MVKCGNIFDFESTVVIYRTIVLYLIVSLVISVLQFTRKSGGRMLCVWFSRFSLKLGDEGFERLIETFLFRYSD